MTSIAWPEAQTGTTRTRAHATASGFIASITLRLSRRTRETDSTSALVHRRSAVPLDRRQLHRPADAQRARAVLEDRLRLVEHGLRLCPHRVSCRIRGRP